MITRAFTGELGAWEAKPDPMKTIQGLRPPPWSRLRTADVERMNKARAAAAKAAEEAAST